LAPPRHGKWIKKDKEPVVVDIKNRDSETVVESETLISSKIVEKEKVVENVENGKDQKEKIKRKDNWITSDYKTPEKGDKKLNDHKRNKIQIQIKKKGQYQLNLIHILIVSRNVQFPKHAGIH